MFTLRVGEYNTNDAACRCQRHHHSPSLLPLCRYLAKGVELSIGPCMEMVAAERSRNGDTFGAADLWRRAAALDNLRAISVWEGISLREASTRIFGNSEGAQDAPHAFLCQSPNGGILDLTATEAGALGIVVDDRYRCASCNIVGRLGDAVEGKVRWLRVGSTALPPPTAPWLDACSACRVVLYCSKACQRAAWKGGHREECAGIGAAAAIRRLAAERSLAGMQQ